MDPPPLSEIGLALRSPSYISFESALYQHGILSQSPRGALTLATTKRPGRVETPWGILQFIHLKTSLFFGYDAQRVAQPEKAWLDLIYIRGRRGRRELITETFYFKGLNRRRLKEFGKSFPVWARDLANRSITQKKKWVTEEKTLFMKLWNISEAKANLSAMIERVSKGEEIIIGKAGKPVAKLVRYEPALHHKRLGLFSGKIQIAPDFDQWPDEFAEKNG